MTIFVTFLYFVSRDGGFCHFFQYILVFTAFCYETLCGAHLDHFGLCWALLTQNNYLQRIARRRGAAKITNAQQNSQGSIFVIISRQRVPALVCGITFVNSQDMRRSNCLKCPENKALEALVRKMPFQLLSSKTSLYLHLPGCRDKPLRGIGRESALSVTE